MFKCTDCGKTYETKPEFCSCGGNSFEAVVTTAKPQHTPTSSTKRKPMPPQQLASIAIFALCLILAIVPWLIKVKDATTQQTQPTPTQKISTIPDIDSFWDNKPAEAQQKQTPQPVAKPVQQKVSSPTQKATAQISPKTTTTQTKQTTKQPKNEAQQQKTTPKSPTKATQKEPQKQSQTSTPSATEKPKTTPKPTVDPKVMYEYKKNLNIALASHMNFLDIQGNGKCAVQFSIDQNGKLINRGFVSQSDNVSVNNEVYKMLMRMPTFSPPPSGYNGEKFKISFEIENGNYKFAFFE